MSRSTTLIDFDSVRADGYDAGYRARRAMVWVPNPYENGTEAHHHWSDGYDLGVLAARDSEFEIANDW